MRIIMVLAAAILVASCSQTQNKSFVTDSGIKVSLIDKGDGTALIKDSIVLMYVKIVTGEEETVLMEANESRPLALAYDPKMEAGDIQDVLNSMQVGDSVSFETTVQNLFEETYKTQVPPDMDSAASVNINLRLAKQMSKDAYTEYSRKLREEAMAKDNAILEEKKTTDIVVIDEFLDSLGITAMNTASGMRYIITEPGSGANAEPGDKITVHYDGRLLSGEPFDSSRDRGEPFSFTVGQGQVIPGWDEGIPYIKEGGKGTLYIPSPLAYGARSPSPKIPAFSILVFDVEVLKVEKQ